MKILVTGGNGQLGRACKKIYSDHELLIAARDILDITNADQCKKIISEFLPEIIIHAAGYTDVRKAEAEQSSCYEVNVQGTYNLARLAKEYPCKFVYISTDFIYDGKKTSPYYEDDSFYPLNVYGRSKLAGELIVRDLLQNYFVVRTSWVFGDGKNYVRTILNLSKKMTEFSILDDQIGSPTFAEDLAKWLFAIFTKGDPGIYHACNTETTNWASYAEVILKTVGKNIPVHHITTEQYMKQFNDYTAKPKYSVLNTEKTQKLIKIRPWQEALQEYIKSEEY